MISNFYRAYTGLEANSLALSVVGNNLSNINSVGFKRGEANFAQLITNRLDARSGNGNPIQFGLGVKNTEVVNYFEQGSFINTGIGTNLALEGRGFFAVNNGGNINYTRAGNFSLQSNGALMAANGGTVQGYTEMNADGTINTTGDISDIIIDFDTLSPAEPTETVRFVTNLSASAEEGTTFSSNMEVFDSNGIARPLELVYTKTANVGEWTYEFRFQDGTVSTTEPTQGSGVFTFGPDGLLSTVDGTPVTEYQNRQISIGGLPDGADDLTFTWDLIDFTNQSSFGYMTNLGNRSNTGSVFQDGTGIGELQRVEFDNNGVMFGFFTNGDTVPLAHLAVATFDNNQGLKQSSSGFFIPTNASGAAELEAAGNTLILSGTLETSNVDIAEEFTSLIIHQRGYQSNSKTITTSDQMLQEVINLKR